MRTATPLRTWSVMTDRGRSATSAAISTPRFIGPGVHHERVAPGSGRPAPAVSP